MRTWPATNDAVELYDLRADPGERTDRAAADPAGRDELLDDLLRWLAATRAPLPTRPNPAYNPAARQGGG